MHKDAMKRNLVIQTLVYQRDGSFGLWKDGVLYIYLASGNQKNRPFGAIPLFPRNQPPLKMSPIGIQPPPPADTPSVSKIIS